MLYVIGMISSRKQVREKEENLAKIVKIDNREK